MKCCAVVDTNVLVAALLSKRNDSPTVRVIRAMISGEFIPLYHKEILAEYEDVLHRKKKYDLSEAAIQIILNAIRHYGIEVFPRPTGEIFVDEDDIIFGSITKLVGFRIPDIVSSAHVKQLQEEVFIIRISISLSAKSLDLVVDAFDFRRGYIIGGVSNDPFKMIAQQPLEPEQMGIAGCMAHVHDTDDILRHGALVRPRIGQRQFLFDQVKSKEELILPEQLIIALFVSGSAHDILCFKQTAPLVDHALLRGIGVLLLKRLPGGRQNILCFLQCPGSFDVAFLIKAALFVLTHFAYYLIVEVLDDMEVIEYWLDMGALFLKRLLEIGIHVAGDGFDMVYPLQTDMLYEVVHDLLLLASGDPEDMPGLHVDDVSGIPVPVVELEFINAKEFRMLCRLDQLSVRCSIKLLKTSLINRLYDVLTEAGKLCDLLVCVSPASQQIADILIQFHRDPVPGRFKRNVLHPGIAALGTYILRSGE